MLPLLCKLCMLSLFKLYTTSIISIIQVQQLGLVLSAAGCFMCSPVSFSMRILDIILWYNVRRWRKKKVKKAEERKKRKKCSRLPQLLTVNIFQKSTNNDLTLHGMIVWKEYARKRCSQFSSNCSSRAVDGHFCSELKSWRW